jgi:chromosome segregation ATPase
MKDQMTHAEAVSKIAELLEDIEQLKLAEEGAKEAFSAVVQQKRDLEAKCKRLSRLLSDAHESIRRMTQGHNGIYPDMGSQVAAQPDLPQIETIGV